MDTITKAGSNDNKSMQQMIRAATKRVKAARAMAMVARGKGGGCATVTRATQRARVAMAMATATRVAGNKEGNCNGYTKNLFCIVLPSAAQKRGIISSKTEAHVILTFFM